MLDSACPRTGVRPHDFATIDQARAIVLDWCYGFYNHDRRHSTIGMLSPINYETSTAVPAGEAA